MLLKPVNWLHYCVHKGRDEDGEPMWNADNKLIKFIPETEVERPSYHLPHFYEVFAECADGPRIEHSGVKPLQPAVHI